NVHKTPQKTRPVVAACSTIFHGIGVWAGYHLPQLNPLVPSNVKTGFELKERLEALGQLPQGTRMFTMDATAMYTNNETDHGLEMIKKFFELFEDQLPDGFPRELILLALRLIMKINAIYLGTNYIRGIDDGFILWNNRDYPIAYYCFCKDAGDFGILRWTVEERSKEVIFLDLTIKINDSNRIKTRTYQKPINVYLYLHHADFDPPGELKGMIY
ncbi:hypothetical protein ACHAWF_006376, partial [Thalassiosira exigua]